MYDAFTDHDRQWVNGAVGRSQEIADSVSIELELGKRHFPGFDLPAGRTAADELKTPLL